MTLTRSHRHHWQLQPAASHQEHQLCAGLLGAVRHAPVVAQQSVHQAWRDEVHGIMLQVRRLCLAQLQAFIQLLLN